MRISKEMKVAEVFEKFPETRGIFQKFGFGALMNPALRNTFGRMTSVEAGCRLHGVNLAEFLDALNAPLAPEENADAEGSARSAAQPAAQPAAKIDLADPEVQRVLAMKTDELVKESPATRDVFVKHFGAGCFSCPAFGQESVAFACSMHNTDPAVFATDCLAKMSPEIRDSDTINDLIRRYPATLPVLQRHGIDSCCGGMHRLEKAASAHHMDLQLLKKELADAVRRAAA